MVLLFTTVKAKLFKLILEGSNIDLYWKRSFVAILYGMFMGRNSRVTKLIVESDCLEVVKLLDDKKLDGNQFLELLTEIWSVKGQFQLCHLVHIPR